MKYSRLKAIRKAKGFTQQQMAEMLGYKDKSGYCQLENGDVKMTLEKAIKISQILKVEIDKIFFDNQVEVSSTKEQSA